MVKSIVGFAVARIASSASAFGNGVAISLKFGAIVGNDGDEGSVEIGVDGVGEEGFEEFVKKPAGIGIQEALQATHEASSLEQVDGTGLQIASSSELCREITKIQRMETIKCTILLS